MSKSKMVLRAAMDHGRKHGQAMADALGLGLYIGDSDPQGRSLIEVWQVSAGRWVRKLATTCAVVAA